MSKSPIRAALDELEACARLLQVWLIMKDGNIVGKITARTGRNEVIHVALIMYPLLWVGEGVHDYERMTGCGYPKVSCGIETLLCRNKEQLAKYYKVSLSLQPMNTWRKDFEASGFSVIDAL